MTAVIPTTEEENTKRLVQGYFPLSNSGLPNFCTKPTWYLSGCEKKVKIGTKSFNAVDYLEAWCNINCNTYRSDYNIIKLKREIAAAFSEVNNK